MLHDIRNFCTAQLLITERLLRSAESNLTPFQLGLLKRANRQAQYMCRTVEDLRVLARLKERRAPPPDAGQRLDEVLRRALNLAQTLHFDRPFDTFLECPAHLLASDPQLVECVFFNLFDNAVRHTSQHVRPAIEVRVTTRGALTMFSVRGGTPPERRVFSRLFARYTKGAASTGSGLGLSLIRDIVEEVGGRIEARLAAGPTGPIFEVFVTLPRGPIRSPRPVIAVR